MSLLADFVYEGARSVTGPLLAGLGASAMLVGVVTGAGEAAALVLRLVSGPLADRTRRFWAFTIAGYGLTVITVPLLGLTATLWVACALVIAERVGKAVRSPAKDTLLSHATAATGRGRASRCTRRWIRSGPCWARSPSPACWCCRAGTTPRRYWCWPRPASPPERPLG